MSAAQQVYYTPFDAVFFKLPAQVRERIESRIDDLGLRLGTFPHHRLTGSNRHRLRVGDYRVIYEIQDEQLVVLLLKVGHRREIYR